MTRKKLFLPLAFSLLLLAILFGLVSATRADLQADETPLDPDGGAYEINADPLGILWVSDTYTGEVRAYHPGTGVYTTYLEMGAPSDARRGADGMVWWVDLDSDQLGRLDPASSAVQRWDLPASSPYGTAVDSTGAVWVSDFFNPVLVSFDPAAGQLCTYNFGDPDGASDYILAQDGFVWLGDWINDAIHRLAVGSGQLTSWELPFNVRPQDLAVDDLGDIWWADYERGELGRLQPDENLFTRYDPPGGGTPEMVATNHSHIWYTDDLNGRIGRLEPALASGNSYAISPAAATLSPSCASVSPASSATIPIQVGEADWSSVIYTTSVDADGWLISDLPDYSYPWGIATVPGQVWFVDDGRQVLGRILQNPEVAACKLEDEDGDLNTTGDQTPVPDWTLYLVVNGVRQEPGQLTGNDGCTSWYDLEPGITYGVEEEIPEGWQALTPTSHDFELSAPGDVLAHTFVNVNIAQITACKLEDGDGDLATSDDQTPLPGWPVWLSIDGIKTDQQLTGSDGCYTWNNQLPGATYGVGEDDPAGWQALTPTSHDFGKLSPGEQVSHTFINAQEDEHKLYLPLVIK